MAVMLMNIKLVLLRGISRSSFNKDYKMNVFDLKNNTSNNVFLILIMVICYNAHSLLKKLLVMKYEFVVRLQKNKLIYSNQGKNILVEVFRTLLAIRVQFIHDYIRSHMQISCQIGMRDIPNSCSPSPTLNSSVFDYCQSSKFEEANWFRNMTIDDYVAKT